MVLALAVFAIFKKRPTILTHVCLIEDSLPIFHVVTELTTISLATLVKILSTTVFFVLEPVTNIEFSTNVVVFSFAMLHAIFEFSHIPLTIVVCQCALTLQLAIDYLA